MKNPKGKIPGTWEKGKKKRVKGGHLIREKGWGKPGDDVLNE